MISAGLQEPEVKPGSERRRFRIDGVGYSNVVANFEIKDEDIWDDIKPFHRTVTNLIPEIEAVLRKEKAKSL